LENRLQQLEKRRKKIKKILYYNKSKHFVYIFLDSFYHCPFSTAGRRIWIKKYKLEIILKIPCKIFQPVNRADIQFLEVNFIRVGRKFNILRTSPED